ncbi:MAG: hypothetical protein HON70_25070, partial [Lentisphaerae bacterium]|nr:hypothetical protein [Lentisphaerota bacterium]
ATRMARDYPWFGVGAGHYQQHIGPYYRELPNPNVNAVERDTQAGYGILAGTMGFTTLAVFVVVMLLAITSGLRAAHGTDASAAVPLGGAVALLVIALGSVVSDPFVRGVGWYLALGFASAFMPGKTPSGLSTPLGIPKVIAWGAAFGVLVVLTFLVPTSAKPQQFVHIVTVPTQPNNAPPPPDAAPAATTGAPTFTADIDFFRVIDASEATAFTAPMIADKDPKAAKGMILRIPDEKGKPPEGEEPDMKHGGATFDVDVAKPVKCRVWVRTWWEGSCGNSMYVRPAEGTKALVIGNDGTYEAWHWLPLGAAQTFDFPAGKTTIAVLNREDGVRFDQILITGDLQYIPQGIEEE